MEFDSGVGPTCLFYTCEECCSFLLARKTSFTGCSPLFPLVLLTCVDVPISDPPNLHLLWQQSLRGYEVYCTGKVSLRSSKNGISDKTLGPLKQGGALQAMLGVPAYPGNSPAPTPAWWLPSTCGGEAVYALLLQCLYGNPTLPPPCVPILLEC